MNSGDLLIAILLFVPALSLAGDVTVEKSVPDKGRYQLWNPTPPELLRALSTDRPDATGSPYTVDAGVRIGLNHAAEDFGVFTGLSVRF